MDVEFDALIRERDGAADGDALTGQGGAVACDAKADTDADAPSEADADCEADRDGAVNFEADVLIDRHATVYCDTEALGQCDANVDFALSDHCGAVDINADVLNERDARVDFDAEADTDTDVPSDTDADCESDRDGSVDLEADVLTAPCDPTVNCDAASLSEPDAAGDCATDALTDHEMVCRDLGPNFNHVFRADPKLSHSLLWFHRRGREMSTHGARRILDLAQAGTELDGRVAVLVHRTLRDNLTVVELQHGDRNLLSAFHEDASHAQLLHDHSRTHCFVCLPRA